MSILLDVDSHGYSEISEENINGLKELYHEVEKKMEGVEV